MKAIVLKDKYIIKESSRSIDRESNMLQVDFRLKLRHGVASSEETSQFLDRFDFIFTYDKKNGKDGWSKLKSLEQEELLHMLYCTLLAHYEVYFKTRNKSAKAKTDEELVQAQRSFAEYYVEATNMGAEYFIKQGSLPLSRVQDLFDQLYERGVKPQEIDFQELS